MTKRLMAGPGRGGAEPRRIPTVYETERKALRANLRDAKVHEDYLMKTSNGRTRLEETLLSDIASLERQLAAKKLYLFEERESQAGRTPTDGS